MQNKLLNKKINESVISIMNPPSLPHDYEHDSHEPVQDEKKMSGVESTQQSSKTGQESTIETLQRTATEQLNRLLQQERTMDSLHSNLDLLMKRYNIEKSYFSAASDWYGELSWWIKLLLGVVFAGIGAGIGALCNMPILMCCILVVIYLAMVFLFMNHYSLSEKRNKRLCEDIIEIEKSLAETIEHLCALEASLKKVMISLCEINVQTTQDLKQFEEQLRDLNEKLGQYSLVIQTLTEAKDSLVTSTSKINTDLLEAQASYLTYQNTLSEKSQSLHLATLNIHETNHALLNSNEKLDAVSTQFHHHTKRLIQVTENMRQVVSVLKEYICKAQNMNDELYDKQEASIDSTLSLNDNIDDFLSHTHSTVSKALSQMDEYDQTEVVNYDVANELSAKIRQITEDNNNRFSRIEMLLKNQSGSNLQYWTLDKKT
ncbi:MAG: hypothetical protein Q8R24_05275 [Legionellaceae bacterium]|nr:hypothetical protein [Legionellaceae bacterium]